MRPLEGIRVLEVAMYGFVPSAGAVLAEWGADVIKVEHAVTPSKTVSGTKNLPSNYENLTLTLHRLARRPRNPILPAETL